MKNTKANTIELVNMSYNNLKELIHNVKKDIFDDLDKHYNITEGLNMNIFYYEKLKEKHLFQILPKDSNKWNK